MSEKLEVSDQDQIVLTRVGNTSPPKYQVHRTGPGRGMSGTSGFIGTFEEAVANIRDTFNVE